MIAMGLVNCVTGPRVKGGCCLFWCLRRSVRSRHDARSMPGHHTHVHKLSGRSAAKTKQVTLSHAVAHTGTRPLESTLAHTPSQRAPAARHSGRSSSGHRTTRCDPMHSLLRQTARRRTQAWLVCCRAPGREPQHVRRLPPPLTRLQTHTHTHTHTRPLRSKGEPNGRPRRWLLSPAYGQLPGSAPVAASNSSSSLSQSRLASVTMSTRRSTLNLSR